MARNILPNGSNGPSEAEDQPRRMGKGYGSDNGGKGVGSSKRLGALILPHQTDRNLTLKEARFITELLKDPDASLRELAVRAGYSERSAHTTGTIVLQRPHVWAEVKDQFDAFVAKERLSIERLIRHLIALTEVDKREMFSEDGSLKAIKELTKEQATLVRSFSVEEVWEREFQNNRGKKVQIGELKKVTLTDHMEPVKLLAKYLKVFVDRVETHTTKEETHNINLQINVKKEETLRVLKDSELDSLHTMAQDASRRIAANIDKDSIVDTEAVEVEESLAEAYEE